jgi:hypothetical protein
MVTSYAERHKAFRDAMTAAYEALSRAEAAEEAYYELIRKPHQAKAYMAAQTEQQVAAARTRVLDNLKQTGDHLIGGLRAWWQHLDEPRDTIADDPGPVLGFPWDAA